MITAYVLVYALGLNSAFAISGIGSLAACQTLMNTLKTDGHWNLGGTMICYPYQAPSALALGNPVSGAAPNITLSTDANSNLAQSDGLTKD